jgi:aspartate carbamoyltransferase catalytic subunit
MNLGAKDLLGIKEMSQSKILEIINKAQEMKKVLQKGDQTTLPLKGRTVITLFYENSTRTRLSFELAAKYLGASVSNISASGSSVAKGETLIDTGKTIEMMGADVIVIRHPMSGAPQILAQNLRAGVVNAGDGMHEHPTQALLDMFTMIEKKGDLKGLKISIVGDIYHSRVARSNIWGLLKMGAKVTLAGPFTLIPVGIKELGVYVADTIQEGVRDADVVMNLRLQLERQKTAFFPSSSEYGKFFGMNEEILRLAKKDALIMHPGPVNRGLEIQSALVDGPASMINEQVLNGVAVRMAILEMMLGGETH